MDSFACTLILCASTTPIRSGCNLSGMQGDSTPKIVGLPYSLWDPYASRPMHSRSGNKFRPMSHCFVHLRLLKYSNDMDPQNKNLQLGATLTGSYVYVLCSTGTPLFKLRITCRGKRYTFSAIHISWKCDAKPSFCWVYIHYLCWHVVNIPCNMGGKLIALILAKLGLSVWY
jgi:hypothetical protein